MSNQFSNIFNPNKLIDRLFKKADNVVWDLSTGRTGVRTRDGIVTLEIEGADPDQTFQTTVNPIDGLGMEVPAFAQQTALDSVKVGDLIIRDSGPGWVTKVNAKSVSIIKPDGSHSNFTPPKTQILDFGTGVMVVRSLLNTLPTGQAGVQGLMGQMMQMQMMAAMMGGDGSGVVEDMMPFMLMSMGAGTTSGVADPASNAFMGGNFAQMMPMIMMAKMMKGNDKSPKRFGIDSPSFNR